MDRIQLNGAQTLVRLLQAERVPAAFGIVGGKLAPLLHAISRSTIPFVGVRHEASASMMAAAVFAGTGRMAVALGEMGPGGLNLASGAGVAFNNNLAALLITSNQHRAAAYPHRGMFMDMDTQAVLAPLTKWNAVVSDARRLPELVRTAFREALSGRPGPVHLDIPQDVLTMPASWRRDEFDPEPARYRPTTGPRPAAESVAAAVALLQQARRPLIVAGGGVVHAGADAAVRELAARLDAPVVPTQMALGVVPTGHPAFIGHGGLIAGDAIRLAFAQADVIVAIGCRFSSWMWDERGPLARREHALVNINVDPAALGSPALHQVAMQADAAQALADLLAALPGPPATEAGWLGRLRSVRTAYEGRLAVMARDTSATMHPAALADAVGKALPADALAVYDGGHTTFWSNDLTPVQGVRTRFHDPGMSHLGFGLPYALALQTMFPGRPVFNLTGDGAFGFTLQELDTARRNRLPVITIIHNNEAWGVIRMGQRLALDFEFGTSLADTDYAAIARGFGCHGEQVHDAREIPAAIARARASGLPAVLDCRTKFLPHPAAPAFGSMNRYGFDALTRAAAAPQEKTMNQIQMLIGGERCGATGGAHFERRNPLDGAVATRAPAATPADAVRAVEAAAKAFPAWSATGPGERRALLLKAAAVLEAMAPRFIAAMAAETGAAAPWAGFNVHLAAGMLQEAAALTTQIGGEVIPSDVPGSLAMAVRAPAGVVLGIAPWNAPVILGVRAVAVPLACGNTAVLKGSELCPATHGLIVEALNEAGLPPGVLNFVTNAPADAAAVVEAMVAHPRVRRVNFTGSTRVGRLIARSCAEHLKPVVLELGGKAPLVVLDDADLEAAVNAAVFGAFANSGQICMSTERLVVDASIADAFVAKLAARAVGLPLGDPRQGPVVLGSVVDMATVERCNALIDDALERGATLVCGGKASSTLMPATLLDHVTPAMRIYHEESFGPVKPVVRVQGEDEAVTIANDNAYGLSAAVFGRDMARAWRVAQRIESGICHVNGPTVHDEAQMPFGGVKGSGHGRFGGKAGIDAFTELRWVTMQTAERHYPF